MFVGGGLKTYHIFLGGSLSNHYHRGESLVWKILLWAIWLNDDDDDDDDVV